MRAVLLYSAYDLAVDSKLEMKRGNPRTEVARLIRKFGPKRKMGVIEKANASSQNAHRDLRNHSVRKLPKAQAGWDDFGDQGNFKAEVVNPGCALESSGVL